MFSTVSRFAKQWEMLQRILCVAGSLFYILFLLLRGRIKFPNSPSAIKITFIHAVTSMSTISIPQY